MKFTQWWFCDMPITNPSLVLHHCKNNISLEPWIDLSVYQSLVNVYIFSWYHFVGKISWPRIKPHTLWEVLKSMCCTCVKTLQWLCNAYYCLNCFDNDAPSFLNCKDSTIREHEWLFCLSIATAVYHNIHGYNRSTDSLS